MTPTLAGRWQIRLFLLGTVGLIIALIVYLLVKSTVPLLALLYVLLFGLVWDALYQIITSFRWDRDWPTSFQVAAGILEGVVLWAVIVTGKLPGIAHPPPFYIYLIEYAAIWLSIFLLTQGPLRIFSIHWRYQGGQWFMSHPKESEDVFSQPYPAPALQAVGANVVQQAVSPQLSGRDSFQQPAWSQSALQQTVRASTPVYQQSQAALTTVQAVQPAQSVQAAQPYVCTCSFTSDRSAGKFCPNCGRPKI
jgi:hypothetical protein